VARSATGVVTCWNPAAGVVLPQLFEPPPPRSMAAASPPYPRRGTLVPSFAAETTFPRLELVNEIG
jgi:hypothetical protein